MGMLSPLPLPTQLLGLTPLVHQPAPSLLLNLPPSVVLPKTDHPRILVAAIIPPVVLDLPEVPDVLPPVRAATGVLAVHSDHPNPHVAITTQEATEVPDDLLPVRTATADHLQSASTRTVAEVLTLKNITNLFCSIVI